jgi:hypothetical protein
MTDLSFYSIILADDQFKKWLEYGESYSKMNPQTIADLSPFKPLVDLFAATAKRNQQEDDKD